MNSLGQNPDRQLDGVEVDTVFTDTVSGKSADGPQLSAMLWFVRAGDIVIVHSMDRLARNLDDLRRLVRELTGRGVRVQFSTEQLTFSAEHSPMATLLLSVLGAFAEFARVLIRERQQEGSAASQSRRATRRRHGLPNYRLCRYADDWCLTVSGTKVDAETVAIQQLCRRQPRSFAVIHNSMIVWIPGDDRRR